jgi:hypothetical protein
MKNLQFGQKRVVHPTEIWNNEEDFSTWLARKENISKLGETLGLDLKTQELEARVGPYRADILCQTVQSRKQVVIENQIEETDHKHLGQVLLYAAGRKASFVVWIAPKFTKEHRAALDWLNEKFEKLGGDPALFGVEIELMQIGGSAPSLDFNVVSKPKTLPLAGRVKQMRSIYWMKLADLLQSNESPLRLRSDDGESETYQEAFLRLKSPVRGFYFGCEIPSSRERKGWIGVYIGSDKRTRIKLLHQIKRSHRKRFEREVGATVDWSDKEGCFWACPTLDADPADTLDWQRQHQWLKTMAERVFELFPKYLNLVSAK